MKEARSGHLGSWCQYIEIEMSEMPNIAASSLQKHSWTDTYREVASKAQLVREIFQRRDIKLRAGSALSRLLKQADVLTEAWDQERVPDLKVLCEAAHVNRLADSITALPDEPGIQEALRRMAGSVMQPDERTFSQGKDALWEIALLADFRIAGLASRAAEPDIVVNFGSGDYPVACKKIWSDSGVRNQIRAGAKQLRPFKNGGIIAFNLDELVPVGKILVDETAEGAMQLLNEFNHDFKERHFESFQRAISKGECDGFIFSTSAASILWKEAEPFNLITQKLLWNSLEAAQHATLRFHDFAYAQHGVVNR